MADSLCQNVTLTTPSFPLSFLFSFLRCRSGNTIYECNSVTVKRISCHLKMYNVPGDSFLRAAPPYFPQRLRWSIPWCLWYTKIKGTRQFLYYFPHFKWVTFHWSEKAFKYPFSHRKKMKKSLSSILVWIQKVFTI